MSTFFDFGDWHGKVPAHRHPNGGGWVADTATVAETAYVGPGAKIHDNAWVSDNARVSDNAKIYDNARVSGKAWVSDNARVSDNADFATGFVGGYHWTAYRCASGWRLRYGCENHPLSAWRRLHAALAIKHRGSGAHAAHTRAAEAQARAHIANIRNQEKTNV